MDKKFKRSLYGYNPDLVAQKIDFLVSEHEKNIWTLKESYDDLKKDIDNLIAEISSIMDEVTLYKAE
ncbi:MAG: hypothetical protein K0R31_2296, partial [Clostridiales bacterium]|nr:hypothetical protein [Clostridiales bacterium]